MTGFDMDAVIAGVAEAMALKYPRKTRPAGGRFEVAVRSLSRDRDTLDLIARKRQPPMRYVDDRGSAVVLPAGVRAA